MALGLAEDFVRLIRRIVGLPEDEGTPPDLMRLGLYRARVDACASDGSTMDVTPEDKRISPEKSVPVRVGVPGSYAVVQTGATVLLGWERGDPARPYCVPSWESGATVTKLVINANDIELAGNTHSVILDTLLSDLATALGYIPTAASMTYPGLVPNVTQWSAFITALGNGTYQSTKVKNG